MIWIHPDLKSYFSNQRDLFAQLMQLRGEVYRKHKNRCTQQIRLGNNFYFLKQHHGIGWREIFRNLRGGRWPILDARAEWRAIRHLKQLQLNVPEIYGFGWRGTNPAKRESFLLTKALPPHITLEALIPFREKLTPLFKQQLIKKVATLSGILHSHGINHRDFYLCHLLLDRRTLDPMQEPCLHILDLHRAGIRHKTPKRWILKDLAALDFSARAANLTKQDQWRFQKTYEKKSGPHAQVFWQKIKKKGNALYEKHGK